MVLSAILASFAVLGLSISLSSLSAAFSHSLPVAMLLSVQTPAVLKASSPQAEMEAQLFLEKSLTSCHTSLLVSLTAAPRSDAAALSLAQSA